jgi:hypothetical protein
MNDIASVPQDVGEKRTASAAIRLREALHWRPKIKPLLFCYPAFSRIFF